MINKWQHGFTNTWTRLPWCCWLIGHLSYKHVFAAECRVTGWSVLPRRRAIWQSLLGVQLQWNGARTPDSGTCYLLHRHWTGARTPDRGTCYLVHRQWTGARTPDRGTCLVTFFSMVFEGWKKSQPSEQCFYKVFKKNYVFFKSFKKFFKGFVSLPKIWILLYYFF